MSRAERRYRTQNKIKSRLPFLDRIYDGKDIPLKKIGRCSSHHPYDCGNPKCYCCHSCKIDGIKTIQEKKSDLDFNDFC